MVAVTTVVGDVVDATNVVEVAPAGTLAEDGTMACESLEDRDTLVPAGPAG